MTVSRNQRNQYYANNQIMKCVRIEIVLVCCVGLIGVDKGRTEGEEVYFAEGDFFSTEIAENCLSQRTRRSQRFI